MFPPCNAVLRGQKRGKTVNEATGRDFFFCERGNIITERLLWVGGKNWESARWHLSPSSSEKCVWEGRAGGAGLYSHLHKSIFSIGASAPSLDQSYDSYNLKTERPESKPIFFLKKKGKRLWVRTQ
ncbi:UNVERIFIED_CONTAM: hypothetical protein K2H54_023659 [Gekko kuhli]